MLDALRLSPILREAKLWGNRREVRTERRVLAEGYLGVGEGVQRLPHGPNGGMEIIRKKQLAFLGPHRGQRVRSLPG